jgi:glycosyltransferase involved in cell wall biosynthesis
MVVHVSQLLGLKHAPTALLLSMVDGVLKQDPSVELLIAVEECLVPSPDEDVVRAMRRANVSSALRGDHVAWMSERGWERRVRFHYANTGDTRRQRTADLLDAVGQFAPEAVIGIGTDASIARVVLHERYPYLAVSLGGGPACGRCHVYVPSMPAAVMEASWPEGLRRPPAIRELALHVETPTPLRPWGRGDLGLPEEATVLVTVGNRLRWEVSDDFLALVLGLLEARPNLRWVLVGDEVELLAPRIPARLADRVRLHGYEKDLSGLLTVCDLYVNPFRSGGGISVSMAMNAGIAVLVRGDSTDGRYWVGDAAEAWDAEGYRRALERLATDAEARRENGRHVKARIATFSAERSSRRLMDLIEESKAIFKARGATVS